MAAVKLTWSNPTTRTDATPLALSDIAAITFFDDATPGVAVGSVSSPVESFTTGTIAAGAHNFTAVVTDTQGNQSAPSNVASVTIAPPKLAPPSAIANLTATVIE